MTTETEPTDEFLSRERSPFVDLDFSAHSLSADLIHAVAGGLTEPVANDRLRAGQVLASAIWNGAFLARPWWQSWLNGLVEGTRLDGTLWIEMAPIEANADGKPTAWPRRWFADPISQILIVRWLAEAGFPGPALGFTAESCLRDYLMLFRDARDPGDPVEDLYHAAGLRWRTLMPGLLVEHALGRSPSFPCLPATWHRLMTGRAVPAKKRRISVRYVRPKGAATRWTGDEGFYARIQDALEEASKDSSVYTKAQQGNRAVKELASLVPDDAVSPSMRMLSGLAIAMLTQGLTANGKRYKPSSTRDYLQKIRDYVFYGGSGFEHLTCSGEAFQAHCLAATEGLAPNTRNKLLSAIGALQRFLATERPDLRFDWTEFSELYEDTDGAVNLVSSADYAAAMRALSHRKAIDIQMLRISLMLGFRAGLRASEIRALGVHDVTVFGRRGEQQVEIVVRRKPHANSKTIWSRRVLPLHLLLTPAEMTEFLEWLGNGQRLAELTDWPYLFVFPDRPLDRLDERQFTKPLEKVLRHVTADEGVKFGSLRHSFISNLLATLLWPSEGTSLPTPSGLDEDVLSYSRKVRLQDALMGRERLGQAALHAVSQLVGHAPVSTTLKSYAHLLDWSIGACVCRPMAQRGLTIEQAQQLSKLSESAIRKAVQRSSGHEQFAPPEGPGYRRPELVRRTRRRGRTGELPAPSAYADTFLGAATRQALRGSGFQFHPGETVARRVPFILSSERSPGADRLNWRLIKAVLDFDHGLGDGASLRETARRLDIPINYARRWAENRRRFMAADLRKGHFFDDREVQPRHFASRTLRPGADGRAKDPWLTLQRTNFPSAPRKHEIALVDKIWANASIAATAKWQTGLEAFRDGYDGRANLIGVNKWRDARELAFALQGLDVLKHFQISIGARRRGAGALGLDDLLSRKRAPRGWAGKVIFRLKSRQLGGRGYSIRFALTMLTIADCQLLAQEKRGSAGGFIEHPETVSARILSRHARMLLTG